MSKYAKEVNECLISIQKGDQSEIKTLINITSNHLKAMIKGYLVNKIFLNDVLFETYERVLLYIKSFNPLLDGYNWMCRIAKNLSYAYNKDEMPTENIDDLNEEIIPTDWQESIETKIDLELAIKYTTLVLITQHYFEC